jgi:hypothetical protein
MERVHVDQLRGDRHRAFEERFRLAKAIDALPLRALDELPDP